MKILLINKFLYPKGGDAISTIATGNLLSSKGHQIILWGMEHHLNPEYSYKDHFVSYAFLDDSGGLKRQIRIAFRILYCFEAKKKVEQLIRKEKPDIIHLNNFAHQISPSVLHVFRKYNIPTVMTMHDYKLVCASYSMLSKGKVCELCGNGRYYQCFLKGCVKNSRIKSLLGTFEMYLHHKLLRIYDSIDIFISPSQFLKAKCEEMGFKGKIIYLPNFVNLEEYKPQYDWKENSIVYFGRLSEEKGLFTLLEAMKGLDVRLNIIGEGPIENSLKSQVSSHKLSNIEFLGYKTGEELKKEIRKSIFVVLPSQWYENNPRSVIEAFALGKPVVGARIGGIQELIKDNETGLTFESGNADDLRVKTIQFLKSRQELVQMGRNAREFVEREFNAEKHYEGLMRIYESAQEAKSTR